MPIRATLLRGALLASLFAAGCSEPDTGPVAVSAIGGEPKLINPNLQPIDPPTALLIEATAQGLVRFNAAGEIEPALAQRWIVSDDGLRYTFRLSDAEWSDGDPVTAKQVVERLRAALSPASNNPLKPLLGTIDEIVAMTDDVLEISLKSPRPNFLQLLAHPEMAIVRNGGGTGPYHVAEREQGYLALHQPRDEEDGKEAEADEESHRTVVILRGERASLAVARFLQGSADFVTGGTAGDLPVARAGEPGNALRFDPVSGLFGVAFASSEGLLGDPEVRRALSMAVDRSAIVAALGVPDLQPRTSLLPPGLGEVPRPAQPTWAASPLPMRRAFATRAISAAAEGEQVNLRVAVPDGPGYRLIFAHLRRDWRLIGVTAEAVTEGDKSAQLRLVDMVAPAMIPTWYLRFFSCENSPVCDASADEMLDAARIAPTIRNRAALLANADQILTDTTPFISLTAPVRWSLVSPRLTGFKPNPFGHHGISELIAPVP